MERSTTRRALFASAAAIAFAAPAAALIPATTSDQEALAKLDAWACEEARLNADFRSSEEETEAAVGRLLAMETELYEQPCQSLGAAIGKLTMLGLSFDRGMRADGTEEAVLAEVLTYLRGRV